MIGGMGIQELIVILLIILLLFGAKRIPEIARGLGKGIREFKRAATEVKEDLELDYDDHQRQAKINRPEPRQKEEVRQE